ncbi:MAG: c-type cytochrome biogenesis protein CcsB [Actinomycetota bacterium]
MADATLARLSDTLFWLALVLYGISLLAFVVAFAYRRKGVSTAAVAIAALGAVGHATSVATRGIAAGRVPWGNMYEYSSMIALLVVVGYVLFVDRKLHLRELGGFAMGIAVVTMAFAWQLYAPAGPLVPALNSIWLKIHVIAMITASSVFSIAFIFTVLYLLKDRAERRANAAFSGSTVGAAYVGQVEEAKGFPTDYLEAEADPSRRGAAVRGFWARLPSSATFDNLAFRSHAIAFPIWTFGTICGAIWASKAWGRYWGWDPKETWAFVTWTIYAGYLHARATSGWRGRRAALIATAGFISLWITYYVVNLWIVGLHSYAK